MSGRFHSSHTERAISGYVFTCTEKAVAQAQYSRGYEPIDVNIPIYPEK